MVGQNDELTDGQTDESYFIGSCPTNVERAKIEQYNKWINFKWNKYIKQNNIGNTNNTTTKNNNISNNKQVWMDARRH